MWSNFISDIRCDRLKFSSSVCLCKILYVGKPKEKLSFSEIWGQEIAEVFSVLI